MNLKDKTVVIDNKTYRYSKIVMLESDKSFIYLHSGRLYNNRTTMHIPDGKQLPQHLYFLSTDKICEGDWFYTAKLNKVIQWEGYQNSNSKTLDDISDNRGRYIWKLIASTNPSLNLPKPSDSFSQVYIDAYNKNEKIEECLVEYEEYYGMNKSIAEVYAVSEQKAGRCYTDAFDDKLNKLGREYRLKVDKNNCITIRKVKESWSREEVVELFNKLFFGQIYPDYTTTWEQEDMENWISENL